MFVYIAGIIGFIVFIYYSYLRSIKLNYKDAIAIISIIMFPTIINIIDVYNTTLFVMTFTVISIVIVYVYIYIFHVKSSVILISFTILKYSLYGVLLAYTIHKILFGSQLKYIYSIRTLTSGYIIADIIIAIIAMILFVFMDYKFIKNRMKNKYIYLNKKYTYSIYVTISYCLENIVIAYFIRWILTNENGIEGIKYIVVYTIISELLIQNILTKAELSYTKYNLERIEEQLDFQINHYKDYELYIEKIRRMLHDFKSHKSTINKLFNQKNYKEVRNFVEDIQENIQSCNTQVICDNLVLDAIIKNKINLCKSNNIDFVYDVSLPRYINIKNIHISIIFNNLLDNSIEACQSIDDVNLNKYINLFCNSIDGKLVCIIENSMSEGKIKIDKNHKFKTTKKDERNHGIGIENLKLTLEKYDGIVDFDIDKNKFIVKFIIPIEYKKTK
ncbi:MAG: GHKL domain-containing protein [Peptostreptococcaceae bacterium]